MKKVAVVGSAQGQNGFGIGKNYWEFARTILGKAEVIIISPSDEKEYHKELIESIDLLLLPGGADLSPANYGEAPSIFTGNPDVFKEAFFRDHLQSYLDANVATFGICLGFQMLNVAFGGKLVQHIADTDTHQSSYRGRPDHKVLSSNGHLFHVNSHHHQGVKLDTLGEGLVPTAISNEIGDFAKNYAGNKRDFVTALSRSETSDDFLIEAFRHREKPVAGVQWHPEEYSSNFVHNLVNKIVAQAHDIKEGIDVSGGTVSDRE